MTTAADQIVDGARAWARPMVSEIVQRTREIANILTTPQTTDRQLAVYQQSGAEARAQLRPGLTALRVPVARRSALALDLRDMLQTAERDLDRWLADERRRTAAAKADVPLPAEVLSRVQSLSALPPDDLMRRAAAALTDADAAGVAEADVLLRAAHATGALKSTAPGTTYGALRRRTDAAMDVTDPRRAAIADMETQATATHRRSREALDDIARSVAAVLAADPEDPRAECDAAWALVAEHAA